MYECELMGAKLGKRCEGKREKSGGGRGKEEETRKEEEEVMDVGKEI